MKPVDINSLKEFQKEGPRRQILFDSEKMRVVLFCLEAGQEIPAHTTTSELLMLALEGKGSFLVGGDVHPVKGGSAVACKSQEPHGMKAEERLVVLAVIAPRP